MKKAALVGAVALALVSFSLAGTGGAAAQTAGGGRVVVTEAHIAYIKQALQLTPGQQPYWLPVEAALRSLTQSQARSSGGLLSFAGDMDALRRVAATATPLLRMLRPAQKQNAIMAARAMGFSHLVAAL
jgi:hypothetical protein